MPFIDTSALEVNERLPGWYGRYFHSPSMTFAHYDFKRGSSIHEHFHPQEEVYEVIEGELELTIDGVKQIAGPGLTRPVSFAWPVELPTPNVALAHSKLNNGFRYWGQDPVPYFQVFYETHYLYYAV